MTPQDQETLALAEYFANYYRSILEQIEWMYATGTISGKRRAIHLYLQYREWLKRLDANAEIWMQENIPRLYQYGDEAAVLSMRSLGITSYTEVFSQLHEEAVREVINTMRQEMSAATDLVSRQLLQFTRRLQLATDEQRAVLQEISRSVALGESTAFTTSNVANRLAAREVGGYIQVGQRTIRLDSYAELVARTHLRVAYTQGTINRLKANEIDLVIVSQHGTICDICMPLENKIFSLSGESKEYPPIDALPNEGTPFHPNCLHVMLPLVEDLAEEGVMEFGRMTRSEFPFEETRNLIPE